MQDLKDFNLKNQYKNYLDKVGLKESRMSDKQNQETKRAFMAGCASMLVLCLKRDTLPSTARMLSMECMQHELGKFWDKQK